jgi:hypothetical protein
MTAKEKVKATMARKKLLEQTRAKRGVRKILSPEAQAFHDAPVGLVIPPEIIQTAGRIVACGDSISSAAKLVGVDTGTLQNHIKRDPKASKMFTDARNSGAGRIAKLARLAVVKGLKKCHPFWFKVAAWKYPIDLPDPDFEAKRALMELEGVTTAQVDELVSGILADLQAAASTPAAREACSKCTVLQDTLARIRERRNQLQGGWQKRDVIRQADLETIK